MKNYPKTTKEQRKKAIKEIRSGKYNQALLIKCIQEVQPSLTEEYINNIVNRKSYDTMVIPIERKWFYISRNRIIALYLEEQRRKRSEKSKICRSRQDSKNQGGS